MQKQFYRLGKHSVSLYSKLMMSLDIVQEGPVPPGAKILAANHPSTSDPFLIMKAVPEQVHILISETLFKVPLFGRYLRRAGHVPVVIGSGQDALSTGIDLLKEGKTVAIYPEGAISPLEGGFHRAHTGVARLALASGAPVIPIGIDFPRERIRTIYTTVDGVTEAGHWYLRGPYAMTIGYPIRMEGTIEDHDYVKIAAERIMAQIVALSYSSKLRRMAAASPSQIRRVPGMG